MGIGKGIGGGGEGRGREGGRNMCQSTMQRKKNPSKYPI
jgi:hypothetical protein